MKHRWLCKCLVLSFLISSVAPSFHYHDHAVTDSDCHLCMLSFLRSQFIVQSSLQLPALISTIVPLLPQEQVAFFSVHANIIFNRSPPVKTESV